MSRSGRPAAAVVAAALVLVSAVGGVVAQDVIRDRDRQTDRLRIAADAGRLETELSLLAGRGTEIALQIANAGELAGQLTARRSLDLGHFQTVAELDAGSTRLRGVLASQRLTPIVSGAELAAGPLADAVQAVLDSTATRIVGPVELDAGPGMAVVAPVVPPGTAFNLETRREAVRGVVIGVVTLDRLLHPPGGAPLWPGADIQIETPTGVIGERLGDVVAVRSLDAANAAWRVAVGPLEGHRHPVGWWALGLGVVIAAAVYLTLHRQQRQHQAAEEEAHVHSRQLELIASTSASLQQSLELADLLPAFCVGVVDEFGLTGASVLVVDDRAQLVEAFRFGDGWPADAVAEFELRRGWSSVGRLVVRSVQPLDDVATQSVRALADLLAAAVSNAALFEREQQAVNRLSELDALKNAFLGTVSHELRTSTTAVQGFGELLTEHWESLPDERRRELAARIKRQAGSLRHLVDDLLDYARIEHQSLQVLPRHVSLTDLVRKLTDSMSPLVADHDVVLDAPEEVVAWVDPIAVERIFANLLSNAGKYAPAGSRVTVRVTRHGDRARLSVADQGPGIPVAERQRVFVRFYRLSNEATVRTRGAGIGLSILHDFAERSGATVAIDDAPGGGALVLVDFPTEAPAPEDQPLVRQP